MDIGNVKGDLLADLWREPSHNACRSSASSASSGSSTQSPNYNTIWRSTAVVTPPLVQGGTGVHFAAGGMPGNYVTRDAMEYQTAPQGMLMGDLPDLTEDNLMYNTSSTTVVYPGRNASLSDNSDEMFNFEQQQQQIMLGSVPQTTQMEAQQQKNNKQLNVNTQLYKTELCASYIKMGICPYGNKCQFAHGENELKSISRSPKWRSKPCANWSKFGSCRYGSRCCFKHGGA